jgi:glycosyltransferase involved in cell wall biosynthesis
VNLKNLPNKSFNVKAHNSHERCIPGVSVIIPAYNCANTIIRTLQSVDQSITYCKNQFDENLAAEVVIVVDNASDDTYSVTHQYIDQRDGFHIIQNQQNYGAGPSRNIGVRHSKGDLLFFLDGDDIFFEDHIYLCVHHLMKFPQIHFAHTLIRIDENIHPEWKPSIENSVPINVCVHRWCHDLIGGYFEEDVFKVCACEDVMYRDLLRQFFSGMTIKKETVQHFRYPGNALDRQMQKFSLHPDAEVDSLTDEQRAVMPEIRRIHTRRTDLIKRMLAHWIDFLRKSGSIKLVE